MFLVDPIKVVDCFFVVVVELRYLGWYGYILELNNRLVEVLEETHVVPKLVEWFGEERLQRILYIYCTLLTELNWKEELPYFFLFLLNLSALLNYFFSEMFLEGDNPSRELNRDDSCCGCYREWRGEFIRFLGTVMSFFWENT